MKRVIVIVSAFGIAGAGLFLASRIIVLNPNDVSARADMSSTLAFVSEPSVALENDRFTFAIRKQSTDGSAPTIATTVAESVHLAASPVGGRIAYTGVSDGKISLIVANADGSGATPIAEGDVYANWSPDGATLVFSPANGGGIFRVPASGGTAETILDRGGQPAWSPDATSIAFTDGGDLWVMAADGSDSRALTSDGFDAHDMEPQWSPDGRSILFRSTRDGTCETCAESTSPFDLYSLDPTTGELSRVTHNTTHEQHAVWSPDGSLIAFDDGDVVYTIDPSKPDSVKVVQRDAFMPSWLS